MPLRNPVFKPDYYEKLAELLRDDYPECTASDFEPRYFTEGILQVFGFNANFAIQSKLNQYPDLKPNLRMTEKYIECYGVCDSPAQIMEEYNFDLDSRNLCVLLTEINADEQPAKDGWRWEKWGEYIGYGNPECTYIYDEPFTRKVYVFHIHEILD